MKRLLLLLFVSWPAFGFTVVSYSLSPATPLVWYQARGPVQGTLATLNGFTNITAAGVNIAGGQRMFQRIKPIRLSMVITTAGVGAGNFTYEAYDSTGAATVCISGNVACTQAAGLLSVDCLATGTASAAIGDDVVVRVNAAACGTAPLGNVSLEYSDVVTDEGVDFVPRFIPLGNYGLDGGGNYFGNDSYQFDSITCGWSSPGVVSGGTDTMRVELLQKSDAGVVCTCDLPGTCADVAGSEHTCHCSGGVKYIGTQVEPGTVTAAGYALQWSTSTNCALNPKDITCAIPFRK